MNLTEFISSLFEQGSASLAFALTPFEEEDRKAAVARLKKAHEKAASEMPGAWPGFHEASALWAAEWMYRAMQLVLLRDLADEEVEKHLNPFPEKITPEVIATADLMMRYLPDLMHFAKRLAPDDLLVKKLNEAAVAWPLSSVGMEHAGTGTGRGTGIGPSTSSGTVYVQEVLKHPSLRAALRDRIMIAKDHRRLSEPAVLEMVETALGDHKHIFWPEFEMHKTNLMSHER